MTGRIRTPANQFTKLRNAKIGMPQDAAFVLQNARIEHGELGARVEFGTFFGRDDVPGLRRLNAHPLAWTPSTNGVVSANRVRLIRSSADFAIYRANLRRDRMNGRFHFTRRNRAKAIPWSGFDEDNKRTRRDDRQKPDGGDDKLSR